MLRERREPELERRELPEERRVLLPTDELRRPNLLREDDDEELLPQLLLERRLEDEL